MYFRCQMMEKLHFSKNGYIFFPFMQAVDALTRSQWIHPDINILQLLYHRILHSHTCTSADNLSQSSRLDTSPHSSAQQTLEDTDRFLWKDHTDLYSYTCMTDCRLVPNDYHHSLEKKTKEYLVIFTDFNSKAASLYWACQENVSKKNNTPLHTHHNLLIFIFHCSLFSHNLCSIMYLQQRLPLLSPTFSNIVEQLK